ncbi:major facilitator superfamily domain-containing protein [Pseudoneurospora amorphoporcata]|uniref:Major facilitator superfamily domain-containing protein n=1 Tax=Pseudoneurospora amorphoporcata TaxID=241081 RepID=A0AAN6SJ94_9PEZI|nr:major facilitator superfamily domain-containing protein [Pseudoneurospora amorphoporcata]
MGDFSDSTSKGTPNGNEDHADESGTSLAKYSVFTRSQLRQLQLLLGLSTITSPLTATIYFPLLPMLREHFRVSAQAINLTLTVYIIFQAISPVIFGPLSDTHGRRPFFLLTLALYVVGNIGLAANSDSYPALITLRALQSLGASAAYAISFGVVADVCLPSERGRILGPISMALNLGACVGPVVGGAVAYTSGSHIWVFWALVIVGVMLFIGVGLFLPETARSLVGNGNNKDSFRWWQLSWWSLATRHLAQGKKTQRQCDKISSPATCTTTATSTTPKSKWYGLGNILACFRLIFYKDTSLTLWVHGSFYTVDYSMVAAIPDIFKDIYGFNELHIGLAYLPRAVGIITGSYFTGRIMDYNYKTTALQNGQTINKATGEHLLHFPLEKARTKSSFWMLIISTCTVVGYGWAVSRSLHPALPLVMQFFQGFWGTFFYTTYSTLLVDSFPHSPSTAAATTSITRCAMAAAGVAILQPLLDATGRGWYFTIIGIWSGSFGAAAIAMLRWRGMKWRRARSPGSTTNPEVPSDRG